MDPFVIGGLVQAGAGLVDSAITARQNAQARKWQESMYARQNADNLKFWNMQNEYNSPQAQMSRLKAAGLNPNLMYGSGASTGVAAQVKAGDAGSWKPSPLNIGAAVGSGLMQYQDLKQRQAQTDLLVQQQKLAVKEMELKELEAIGRSINNNTNKWNLDQKQRMQSELDGIISQRLSNMKSSQSISLGDFTARNNLMLQSLQINAGKFNQETEIRKQHLSDMRQQFNLRQDAMDLKKEMQKKTLELMTQQRLLTMANTSQSTQQTENLRAAATGIRRGNLLKRFEIEMRAAGVSPNDGIFWRVWQNSIQRIAEGKDPETAFKIEMYEALRSN